jgi:hypothetical protein
MGKPKRAPVRQRTSSTPFLESTRRWHNNLSSLCVLHILDMHVQENTLHGPVLVAKQEPMSATPRTFPTPDSLENAVLMHRGNFVESVTRRWRLFGWIYGLFRVDPPHKRAIGLKISIAEMQRVYMRALQIDLVKLGLFLQQGGVLNEQGSLGNGKQKKFPWTTDHFGQVLSKYSMSTVMTSLSQDSKY